MRANATSRSLEHENSFLNNRKAFATKVLLGDHFKKESARTRTASYANRSTPVRCEYASMEGRLVVREE